MRRSIRQHSISQSSRNNSSIIIVESDNNKSPMAVQQNMLRRQLTDKALTRQEQKMFEVHFESDKNSRTNHLVSPMAMASIHLRDVDAATKLKQTPDKLGIDPRNSVDAKQSIRIATIEN